MAHLYSGTSGFAYATWKGDFYPPKLPAKQFLTHYATRLNSSEINYTFRRLPSASTLENWVAATPTGFRFAIKAHMKLTHVLRLQNTSEFLEVFLRAIDPLRSVRRLGPILFQLPPALRCDVPLLKDFLASLPPGLLYTFEFRHASWLKPEVYQALSDRGVSLCLAESEKLTAPPVITGNFVYVRLRKPDYSAEDRTEIAARVSEHLERGSDVYVYFKHEDTPAGALAAEELLKRLSGLKHLGDQQSALP